jgi:hypothetical protein
MVSPLHAALASLRAALPRQSARRNPLPLLLMLGGLAALFSLPSRAHTYTVNVEAHVWMQSSIISHVECAVANRGSGQRDRGQRKVSSAWRATLTKDEFLNTIELAPRTIWQRHGARRNTDGRESEGGMHEAGF